MHFRIRNKSLTHKKPNKIAAEEIEKARKGRRERNIHLKELLSVNLDKLIFEQGYGNISIEFPEAELVGDETESI